MEEADLASFLGDRLSTGWMSPWTCQHIRLRLSTKHHWLRICTGSHAVEEAEQEVA